MAQITIGEVEWGDVSVGGQRESDFMQLEEGDNRVRILSNPQQYAIHWVTDDSGGKTKVNCALEGCPVCRRGNDGDKPASRWLIKVLNRKSNKVKLLEIGTEILKGVKALVQNPDWGAVTEYDVSITRGPKGSRPLYNVVPGRRTPLTLDEKNMLVEFNERVDVARFITPPTPAAVAEKLGWSLNSDSSDKAVSNEFQSNGKNKAASSTKSSINFDF